MARITAQDFYDYDKCPHRVYLNRFGDPQEKLPQSDFLNLLFEVPNTRLAAILVDQFLDRKMPIEQALMLAGKQVQTKQLEYQKEQNVNLFHPADLQLALSEVNALLRNSDVYKLASQQVQSLAKLQ